MKKHKTEIRGPAGMPPLPGGPIDWAAWQAEHLVRPAGNKGRKFGPEVRAKFSAAQRARFARQRAERAALEARNRELEAGRPREAIFDPVASVIKTDRLLGSLQPGVWYSTRDMSEAAPGVGYGTCKAWAALWWREGVMVRQQNPAWKPPERIGMPQEPKWLYRLSLEGEKRHRRAAALL